MLEWDWNEGYKMMVTRKLWSIWDKIWDITDVNRNWKIGYNLKHELPCNMGLEPADPGFELEWMVYGRTLKGLNWEKTRKLQSGDQTRDLSWSGS